MFDPRDDARDRDGREDRARVYDDRDRDDDPREGLMRDLDVPRVEERELVALRDRVYELDGEDSRTLAAVGAFRVVPEHDLDIDHETLHHLRDEGLVETVDLGDDERGLTLTREGRDLLDSHSMNRDHEPSQASLLGSPFENSRIVHSSESDVLDAHNIDVGPPPNQSTNDVVVEVLVCGQSHHRIARLPAAG
jgi:hypothetical protein